MCGINWNQKKQRSLILYTFSLYNTFCNKLLTNNIYLLNIYYERSLQLKHKKTLLTFLMLCGLFILSKPVSAAKVPVIKAGKSTNLKGTIINVKYSGAAVTMANKSATPSIKIGSEIYVPCICLLFSFTLYFKPAACSPTTAAGFEILVLVLIYEQVINNSG